MGNVLLVGGPDERRQQERTQNNNDDERCSSCFAQFSSIATTRRTTLFQQIDNNNDDDDNVVVDEDEIVPPVLSTSNAHSSSSSSCLLKRRSTTNGSSRSSFLLSSPNTNVSSSSSYSKLLFTKQNLEYTDDELQLPDTPTKESDLTSGRPVWIVTTAALPWMTGTAVNPLLRAAYLANRRQQQCNATQVHLVLPWLERPEDRAALYGDDWRDVNVQRQEDYIRNWIHTNVGGTSSSTTNAIQMHWYPARYHSALGSIFAMGDVCATTLVDPECHTTMLDVTDAICLLEEPEHLNYYRGGHWRTRFAHVCGIIHTHYEAYAEQKSKLAAPLIGAVSAWMVRAYCDKVIHLSATLPKYAPEKEVVSNVHGVREVFFQQSYTTDGDDSGRSGTQMYFLGKLLWAKGLDKILELQEVFKSMRGKYFELDIYGNGPDEEEIRQAFARSTITTTYSDLAAAYWIGDSCPYYEHQQQKVFDVEPLPVQFKGRVDHATVDQMHDTGGCYKIFINPSVSEVLCTVTAEALAMGKFVVIPKHPSNAFFEPFQNCLLYESPTEFCTQLQYAMSHQPIVLPDRSALTWEAATERLIRATSISHREAARLGRLFATRDQRLADWHIKIGQGTTGDMVRTVLGGGPVAKQAGTSSSMTSFSRSSSTSTSVASPEVTTEDTTTTITTAITFSTGLDCPSFTESFGVATAPKVSQEFPPTPIIQQC